MIPEIAGSSSWLTDSGPVAALDVLAAHTKIIHRLTAVLLSRCTYMQARGLVCYHVRHQPCSDVMFQIGVCGIMRYFTVFIVGCF